MSLSAYAPKHGATLPVRENYPVLQIVAVAGSDHLATWSRDERAAKFFSPMQALFGTKIDRGFGSEAPVPVLVLGFRRRWLSRKLQDGAGRPLSAPWNDYKSFAAKLKRSGDTPVGRTQVLVLVSSSSGDLWPAIVTTKGLAAKSFDKALDALAKVVEAAQDVAGKPLPSYLFRFELQPGDSITETSGGNRYTWTPWKAGPASTDPEACFAGAEVGDRAAAAYTKLRVPEWSALWDVQQAPAPERAVDDGGGAGFDDDDDQGGEGGGWGGDDGDGPLDLHDQGGRR